MSNAENPDSGQGMVVLDIGGDIGALVVAAPSALLGEEIEICPAGCRDQTPDEGRGWWHGNWRGGHSHAGYVGGHEHTHEAAWPHVAVIDRPVGDTSMPSAVYPGLRAGTYELWLRPDGHTALTVTVAAAGVTTAEWPGEPVK